MLLEVGWLGLSRVGLHQSYVLKSVQSCTDSEGPASLSIPDLPLPPESGSSAAITCKINVHNHWFHRP